MQNKTVVVFGIFDGVHEGHRDFFRQALRAASGQAELIVIVGRDEICRRLKNKTPEHSEEERVQLVAQEPLVDKALLGDQDLSTYQVLAGLKPDVICFGYDQQRLREDLGKWLKQRKQIIEIHSCKKLEVD